MPTLYTNELILSFWLRLCRAGCFVVTSVSLISYKAIQLAGVLADDLVAHLRGQVAQVALDELARVGPHPVRVGEVRAAHDGIVPQVVEQLDAAAIARVGRPALSTALLGRSHTDGA